MRVIFYIIVAYIVYTLVKKILVSTHEAQGRGKGSAVKGEGGSVGRAEETVLDPICESYIPKDRAVKLNHKGKAYYFCGEECRDKFTSERGG